MRDEERRGDISVVSSSPRVKKRREGKGSGGRFRCCLMLPIDGVVDRRNWFSFFSSSQLSVLSLFDSSKPLEQAAFEALLAEPLMLAVAAAETGGEEEGAATAGTSSLAAAVRSAALRQLAGLLAASEDNTDATRALGLFAQAALAASGPGGAGTDVVTWQRLGTLVRE